MLYDFLKKDYYLEYNNNNFNNCINKILLGDNYNVIKNFPKNSIDLIVTSPPYDNLREYQKNKNTWNYEKFKLLAKELFKIMKIGGVIVWVVGDETINGSESGSSFKQALYFKDIGFKLHDTMIYKKNGSPFPANKKSNRYTQIFEYMFILSKLEKPKTVNLLCDKENKWKGYRTFGIPSQRNKDILKSTKKRIVPDFSVRNNIWQYATGKNYTSKDEETFKHPATFPEQLVFDHILTWSNDNDIVLDIFNGSGTTTKIAKYLKRKFIGIDNIKDYCNIALSRLIIPSITHQKQPQYF